MAGARTLGEQGLKVLVSPKNAATVDIVAIPGLGANPTRSWMWDEKDAKSFNWLTDKDGGLQKDFPTARIMLYNYASAYRGAFKIKQYMTNISKTLLEALHGDSEREQSPGRPIVFIGHSMGGLVVARALPLAEQHRKDYPQLFESIVGCVTFGTPFDGAPVAEIAQQWAQINEKLGTSINSKLLDLLNPGNEALRDLKNEFVHYINKLAQRVELHCFFEQKQTSWEQIISKLTSTDFPAETLEKLNLKEYRDFVSRESATITGFPETGLARAHRDLVRFENKKDLTYQLVRSVLKRIVYSAPQNAKSRFKCTRQTSIDPAIHSAVVEALDGAEVEKKFRSLVQRFKLSSGTSESWVIKEPEYRRWLGDDQSQSESKSDDYIWIHGPEGNGKTAAVTAVIKEIKEKIEVDEVKQSDRLPTLLAYFFCDSQATDYKTAEDVVKSLMRQLCQKEDILATYAKQFIKKKTNSKEDAGPSSSSKTALGIENLWQCLQDMLSESSIGTIYFVIANLHELPEPENDESTRKLLSFMQAAIDGTEDSDANGVKRVRTKWLFSSRDRKSIKDALKKPPTVREIDLGDPKYGNNIKRELQKHARVKVESLEKQKGYNKAISYFTSSVIGNLAESTKWIDVAIVQLAALPAKSSDARVRKMLERVPQDFAKLLDKAWTAVLGQAGEDIDTIKELLRALVLTYQDPTESELLVLAGLSSDDPNAREQLRKMIETCKPLLTQTRAQGGGESEISFVNADVKKHLHAHADVLLDLSEDEVELQHGILALRCFSHVVERVTEHLQNLPEVCPDGKEQVPPQQHEPAPAPPSVAGTHAVPGADDFTVGNRSEYDGDSDGESYWSDDTEFVDQPLVNPNPGQETTVPPDASGGNQQQQPPSPPNIILPYATKNWLRHASEGPPDIADRLSQERAFWEPESKIRLQWLVEYQKLTGTFNNLLVDASLKALHIAASIGFPHLVESLMEAGYKGEVNQHDSLLNTPLHLAAFLGSTEIVEQLLNSGAKIDDAGPDGTASTPLAMAAQSGRISVMRKLLSPQWHASPDTIDVDIGPVINGAILSGNRDAVKLLIENNARLNYHDAESNGQWLPPLALAAYYSDITMFDTILEAGAETLSEDEYNRALVFAAASGRVEVVERLVDHNPSLHHLQAALESAMQESNWDVVKFLLANSQGLDCDGVFQSAVVSSENVNWVLSAIWDHTEGNINRELMDSCLYTATDNEKEGTVKLLLEFGANPDAEGAEYGNALTAAANDGTTEIVSALLNRGASIDVPSGYPLHAAAEQGHDSVVQLLLNHPRCPPNLINSTTPRRKVTPLQAACEYNHSSIVQFLLERGADPNIAGEGAELPILLATEQGDEDILNLLLTVSRFPVNVNVIDKEYGYSPLHHAVEMLPASSAVLLLKAGADKDMLSWPPAESEDGDAPPPPAQNNDESAPPPAASDAGGDDDDDESDFGGLDEDIVTPLMVAVDAGDEDCVRVLLEHGADIMALSQPNRLTALEIAQQEGNEECVKLLMARVLVVLKLLKGAADAGDPSAKGVILREQRGRGEDMKGGGEVGGDDGGETKTETGQGGGDGEGVRGFGAEGGGNVGEGARGFGRGEGGGNVAYGGGGTGPGIVRGGFANPSFAATRGGFQNQAPEQPRAVPGHEAAFAGLAAGLAGVHLGSEGQQMFDDVAEEDKYGAHDEVTELHPQKMDEGVDGSEAEDGWHGALDIGGYAGQGYGNFSPEEGVGSDEDGEEQRQLGSEEGEEDDDDSDDGY